MTEAVNHPSHYTACGGPVGADGTPKYETIKVIENWHLGFCLGNALKYILRAPHKGSEKQDLAKALWYLERNSDTLRQREGTRLCPVEVSEAWELPHHLEGTVKYIEQGEAEKAVDSLKRYQYFCSLSCQNT